MKKQYIFPILLLLVVLALPVRGQAAYNTVTFDADTDLYFTGVPATITVSSGSMVADLEVKPSTLNLSMESGSTITLTSSDKLIMTSNLDVDTVCGSSASTLTITSATTQGVSVDITANSCQTGAAVVTTGGSGGGGGSSTPPPSTTKTPAPETTPAEKSISQMTTAEVTAKIAEITQLIAQLQTQLIQMLGGSAMSGISGVLPEINLKTGSTGEAVKLLQTWLAKDAEIYPEGIISGYFGPLTKTAVIRFQEKYKAEVLDPWNFTNGTGIVGPTTRAKLSELFGSQ
ncbi:hypothetical protein COX24_02680 [bacterium (Candidatus Gribaldobacteria) CG23_combo_of_CG06-09_8_20_14_all_37_87_8]|uniref:Peptidoglycan binding-like domain-containing protein n=2 Tax=Candidatus Gribaldobacteria TaxID=2798536 RepID=A0A2G9ZEM5_9BACT|nr:MAG: hypothetical protein AUJ25_00380 [Parcubacteria group bacterium CG1_02_37_13]PIP31607.1 MAG: hypothetical protein COX24_02680 [bacterium (Candidatus Gribaldobacteria) CG23_combo_of_CG06-09_8_20_14_all_37_87_8]PIR89897.1 MAG: hypothetical protein COU05_03760 [bacterium (Candidatus Gribaldobacteria) CG10_big_fil_rev_8_21_14_0_10_37_21]